MKWFPANRCISDDILDLKNHAQPAKRVFSRDANIFKLLYFSNLNFVQIEVFVK